jgi:ATP-dependent Clp protease protease subunit
MQGQSEDIRIHAQEILRSRRLMEEILAKHTGQSLEKIHDDLDRDFILDPEEAKAYGVVDHSGDRGTPASQLTATPAPLE